MSFVKIYPAVSATLDPSYGDFIKQLTEIVSLTDHLFDHQIAETNGVYSVEAREWLQQHSDYKTKPFTCMDIHDDSPVEIPFSEIFQEEIVEIVDEIDSALEAIKKITDEKFEHQWWETYLAVVKTGFQNNTWEDVEKMFLTFPTTSTIFLSIGPIDSYHDKVLGVKKYFSAWLLIKDEAMNNKANSLWQELQSVENINKPSVKLFIGELVCAGGEVAKHNAMGWSRPENPETLAAYGGVKAIASNQLSIHTEKMTTAIQYAVTNWNINTELGEQILQFNTDQTLLPLVLHEYGHTYNKDEINKENLGKYYASIEELRANTNMLVLANVLEQKNILPRETTQKIFLRVILYLQYLYDEFTVHHQREEYYFAALVWIQYAEDLGLVTVGEKELIIHIDNFEERLKMLAHKTLDMIRDMSNKGVKNDMQLQRDTVYTYGEKITKKLGM